jgi:hypothetical protein
LEMCERCIIRGSLVLMALTVAAQASTTVYVDANATDEPHDGSSWCHAYLTLYEALAVAQADTTIRVADGTYWPDATGLDDPREATFQLLDGVAIEGGYAGCGAPDPNERDIAAHETTLSGDLGVVDDPNDNCYHVVNASHADEIAVLDGLSITAGNADNHYRTDNNCGAGVFNIEGSPTLRNCRIHGNRAAGPGGGIFNIESHSLLVDCTFSQNWAYDGGAMCNQTSTPVLIGCTFSANEAGRGGGIHNAFGSDATLTDCVFNGNGAFASWPGGGGGMSNLASSPHLINCTFDNNWSTTDGGGVFSEAWEDPRQPSDPTLVDCSFSGNTAANNGGALCNVYGSATLTRCSFIGNVAEGGSQWSGGGAVCGWLATLSLTECDCEGNSSHFRGGALGCFTTLLELTDCTFTANTAGSGGGLAVSDASDASVLRCSFVDNFAVSAGGGLHSDKSSSALLIGCPFVGNHVGGPRSLGGGALNSTSASFTLIGCTFYANSVLPGCHGGGGAVLSRNATATLMNCTFVGNGVPSEWTGNGGGAIAILSAANLLNCTFSGNYAGWAGGAVLVDSSGDPVGLANCVLYGNEAPFESQLYDPESTAMVSYCCLAGAYVGPGNVDADPLFARVPDDGGDGWGDDPNTPEVDEGANDDFGDLHLLTGSPCIDSGDNGAVPPGLETDVDGDARILSCRVDMGVDESPELGLDCNDNGQSDGCDVYDGTSPDCNENGIPDECEAGSDQDCNQNGNPDLCDIHDGTSLDCNQNAVPDECEELPVGTLYVDDSAVDGANDGSSWADAYLELDRALSHAECAPDVIDEIRVAQGTYTPDDSGLQTPRMATFRMINGVTIAGGFAGWGAADPDARDVALYETILSGDIGAAGDASDNCCHIVRISGADESTILDGFTLTGGNATGVFPSGDRGAGIYNVDGNPVVANCTFRGNAARNGGGMYNHNASPTVTGCTFHDNTSAGGGGMYNWSSSPTLTDCTFAGNLASSYGGALYNSGGTLSAATCMFEGNTADYGGALSNYSVSAVLTDCEFHGNAALGGGYGGAIHIASGPSFALVDCTFSENVAWHGGAVHIGSSSAPTFRDCTFVANIASAHGGALFANGPATLVDCLLLQNRAGSGGGMRNLECGSTLINCQFLGNGAQESGGAFWDSEGTALLANCLFSGNAVAGYGGAINCLDSGSTLAGCTFSGNEAAQGGGLYSIGGSPNLANCVFWGNVAEIGAQIYGDVTMTYSCSDGGWPGNGNIDADPWFVREPDSGGDGWGDDPNTPDVDEGANDDYGDPHLQAGSPCVDAGDNTAVPLDIADLDGDGNHGERLPLDLDGNPRFAEDPYTENSGVADPPYYRHIVDMGAYELQFCFGDLDGDGVVDSSDIAHLLGAYGEGNGMAYEDGDLDFDEDVDLADLAILLGAYGTVCP